MKNSLIALMILLAGVVLFIAIDRSKPIPEKKAVTAPALTEVSVQAIRYQSWQVDIHSQGTVQASREVPLTSEVSGRIIKLSPKFKAGAFVTAGEVLLNLDDSDYRLALSNAKAQLAQAEEQYATIKAQARQAKREWRDLGNDNANQLFLKKPQLSRAKAQLEAAKATKAKALRDIQRCSIQAPFAGRLINKHVELGQFINTGTSLASLYGSDKFEVLLPVSARQLSLLELPKAGEQGLPITLTSSSDPTHSWIASIQRSSAKVDSQTRTLSLIAEIDQPFDLQKHKQALAVGSFVTASIPSKSLNHVARLPHQALQVNQTVLALDQESRLFFAPVKVISQTERWVFFTSQLTAGTQVLVSNLPSASTGMQVRGIPVEDSMQAGRPAPLE